MARGRRMYYIHPLMTMLKPPRGAAQAVSRPGTDDNWMTDVVKGMAGKRLKYRDLIQ